MSEAIVLDSGALIALDRNDRLMWAVLRVAADDGLLVAVPAGVVAQAWRDGARQALLARALKSCAIIDLDGDRARAAGLLCGRTDTADIVDASVALTAKGLQSAGQVTLFTSDPDDLGMLLGALDASVQLQAI